MRFDYGYYSLEALKFDYDNEIDIYTPIGSDKKYYEEIEEDKTKKVLPLF